MPVVSSLSYNKKDLLKQCIHKCLIELKWLKKVCPIKQFIAILPEFKTKRTKSYDFYVKM